MGYPGLFCRRVCLWSCFRIMPEIPAVLLENTTQQAIRLVGRGDTIWISPGTKLKVDPWFANNLPPGVVVAKNPSEPIPAPTRTGTLNPPNQIRVAARTQGNGPKRKKR